MSNQYYTGLIQSTVPVNPIWNTLVHSYNTDNNVLDQKGSANGTLVGGTSYVTGVINQAIQGDGINGGVSFADNVWDVTTDFTMSIWFKHNADTASSFPLIVFDGVNGFYVYESGGTYRVVYGVFANAIIIGSGAFGTTINNVICSLIGTTFKIYLNGVLYTTQTLSVLPASTYKCSLLYNKSSNNSFYNGWVDIPQFYNSGLNATQVTELYNSNNGMQYP